jgi:hypothetical protein
MPGGYPAGGATATGASVMTPGGGRGGLVAAGGRGGVRARERGVGGSPLGGIGGVRG